MVGIAAGPAFLCRGCGGLKLESSRPYSQLDTDDVQTAIAGLRNMYPDAPILLAGFSLGAMLVTKYLAEARSTDAASGGDLTCLRACWLGMRYSGHQWLSAVQSKCQPKARSSMPCKHLGCGAPG